MSTSIRFCGVRVAAANQFGSFSGNSSNLLPALADRGQLTGIYSADPPRSLLWRARILSFHPNLARWKTRARRNVGFYNSMRDLVASKIQSAPSAVVEATHSMQIGAWYSLSPQLKHIHPELRTCSFHDGNFATSLRGLSTNTSLSKREIQQLMDHEKSVYDGLDHIFVMSEWLRSSFLNDFGIPPEKVTTTGSGLSKPGEVIFQKECYDKQQILFIGTDFERKGGKTLLDAFAALRHELPDATLHLIGPTLSPLPPGVIAPGFVSRGTESGREYFRRAFQEASVYAMPSVYEPFGIAFVEAMANRIPCIGANTCAMPEIIDEGETGFLIAPGDTDALTERLHLLLTEPVTAKRFGDAGYSRYVERFTWDAVISKIVNQLQDERPGLA